MQINVREASGNQLNWLVATADNRPDLAQMVLDRPLSHVANYATNAALAVPLLTRELIGYTFEDYEDEEGTVAVWGSCKPGQLSSVYGHDPLEAGLRCFVVHTLGEQVAVPEGLA